MFDTYEREQISHKHSYLHWYGYIVYEDFLGRERHTTFCYTWDASPQMAHAIRWDRWKKSGPKEANEET